MEQLERRLREGDGGKVGGLTAKERELLRSLAIGSTESPVAAQKPVIPTLDSLPPETNATPGELVVLSTTGVVYRFDGSTQSWINIAAAAPTNMVTTDSAQTNIQSTKEWDNHHTFSDGVTLLNVLRIGRQIAGGATYTITRTGPLVSLNPSVTSTVNLPAAGLVDGEVYIIHDEVGSGGGAPVAISGNTRNIDGAASKSLNTAYGTVRAYYNSASDVWFTW
jgi:hypothetical protein